MSLTHNHPDCTGRWNAEWISGQIYWRCEGCGKALDHCDAVARLASRENSLGTTLRLLADAGREILDNERSS